MLDYSLKGPVLYKDDKNAACPAEDGPDEAGGLSASSLPYSKKCDLCYWHLQLCYWHSPRFKTLYKLNGFFEGSSLLCCLNFCDEAW